MNTEITDKAGEGWVCYDAECRLCVRWAKRLRPLLERHGFELRALQETVVAERIGLRPDDLLREMKVITRAGTIVGGGDAVLFLAGKIPFTRLIAWLGKLGVFRWAVDRAYRWIADHRDCQSNSCAVRIRRNDGVRFIDLLPLMVATLAAFGVRNIMSGWAWMWTLCAALFLGCKWLVMAPEVRAGNVRFFKGIGFVLFWPGMDARAFFGKAIPGEKPAGAVLLGTVLRIVVGAVLVWTVAPLFFESEPLLAGWIGMVGFILVLHFGVMDLMAYFWRWRGVAATPLMRQPMKAKSLAEFWGKRWNTGFHTLAERFVFVPLRRKPGWRAATLATFGASGLIHDLVISVPARGGYGLPTLYFVIQGFGVLFEKTAIARRWEAGNGWRGWLFAMTLTVGPAFWVFHPEFILSVIVPFFKTLNGVEP